MRWLPTTLSLLVCLALGALASGCAQRADATAEVVAATLPGLPDDGPYWSRRSAGIEVTRVDGATAFQTSGAPSAEEHPSQPTWLRLDGNQAQGGISWAIWKLELTAEAQIQHITFNFPSSGLDRYRIVWANYATGRWELLPGGDSEGLFGAQQQFEPASEAALHSPGHNAYVAVIVLPGHAVNVAWVELTAETPDIGPEPPMFDDFEPNDTLEGCWPLDAGGPYRASIRMSPVLPDWPTPDRYDFYCLDIPPGHELTATLRFQVFDNLWDGDGNGFENDLDLMLYPANATGYDEYIEQYSSFEIWYYPFEQIHFPVSSGNWKIGVLGALDHGGPNNAEYDLHIFYSPVTRTIEGRVTQEGSPKRFVVFLEPGNFNAVTQAEAGDTQGRYTINGVPDGVYTLKVHGSAGNNEAGHVYATVIEELVVAGNMTNVNIDIEPFGG